MYLFAYSLFYILVSASAYCPLGYSYSSNLEKCYEYNKFPLAFLAAEQYCNILGGRLISINNAFELAEVTGRERSKTETEIQIELQRDRETGTVMFRLYCHQSRPILVRWQSAHVYQLDVDCRHASLVYTLGSKPTIGSEHQSVSCHRPNKGFILQRTVQFGQAVCLYNCSCSYHDGHD